MTPAELQMQHDLSPPWTWQNYAGRWYAEGDGVAVWVDTQGRVRINDVAASEDVALPAPPREVLLAVILVSMGRGSLESIEKDRDDARRAHCDLIADEYTATAVEAARDLYPGAGLYPDQDPPPPTPAKV